MIFKIKNFQSIENCILEIPENSFTCLVGPTNIGKSAVRRAIECLLYNKSEASYIRKGAERCEVELTLKDGTHIKWSRDKKTAIYCINGENYSKLNKTVPEPILDQGFKEISVNKDKLNVQVASQFDNIFLLSETGGRATEILSNLGNLNKIIQANKKCLSDTKSVKSKISVRREDLLSLDEKGKSFKNMGSQKIKVEELVKSLKEIKDLNNKKENTIKLKSKLNKSLEIVNFLRPIRNILVENTEIDLSTFFNLKKLLEKLSASTNNINYFSNLSKAKEIYFDLDKEYENYNKLKYLYDQFNFIKNKIVNYRKLPEPLEDLGAIDLTKTSVIRESLNKLNKSKNNLVSYRTYLKETEERLARLIKEEKEIKKDIKVCPLCDSKLS